MKKMQTVLTATLAAAFALNVAVPFVTPSLQPACEASAVKHKTLGTNSVQKQEIDKLRRGTSFSPDAISDFMNEGFKPDDIRNLYVLKNVIADDFVNIKNSYVGNGKNAKAVLKGYNVSEDEYEDAYSRAFPEDDETDFGRVQRIKNLRYMDF